MNDKMKIWLIVAEFFKKMKKNTRVNVRENFCKDEYNQWFLGHIYGAPPSSHSRYLSTTFMPGTVYGNIVNDGMMKAEVLFANSLLEEIKTNNVPGAIVEFGVYEGFWLEQLDEACRALGLDRPLWGFDSFEGLPEVDKKHDYDCWEKGQYAASIGEVAKRLKCAERPYINLVPGWFSDSFKRPEVQAIKELAFVRIDCDLYQPACECLDFIKGRLSDQAILLFDDWGPNLQKGEAKAFSEWLPHCGMRFDFVALNSIGHLYLRAHKL